MLAILFIGLGTLRFQPVSLVNSLGSDLQGAEASVAQLRERVERIEPEAAVGRIADSAVGSFREEVRQAVSGSEPLAALSSMPETIDRAAAAADDGHTAANPRRRRHRAARVLPGAKGSRRGAGHSGGEAQTVKGGTLKQWLRSSPPHHQAECRYSRDNGTNSGLKPVTTQVRIRPEKVIGRLCNSQDLCRRSYLVDLLNCTRRW